MLMEYYNVPVTISHSKANLKIKSTVIQTLNPLDQKRNFKKFT